MNRRMWQVVNLSWWIMMVFMLAIAWMLSGCMIVKISTPDGYTFNAISFMANTKIPHVIVANDSSLADGSRETRGLTMEGFDRNETEGGKAAVQGATTALIEAIKHP